MKPIFYGPALDPQACVTPLVELAANADGHRDILERVVRLALALGYASAPPVDQRRLFEMLQTPEDRMTGRTIGEDISR